MTTEYLETAKKLSEYETLTNTFRKKKFKDDLPGNMREGHILTPPFVLRYVHLFDTDKYDRYGVTMLFPEKSTNFSVLQKTAVEVAKERFGEKKGEVIAKKTLNLKSAKEVFPNDDTSIGMKTMPAYKKKDITVVDLQGDEITDPSQIYAGCYARAIISVYAPDKGGDQVCIGLEGVQLVKKGEPINVDYTKLPNNAFGADISLDLAEDLDFEDDKDPWE